MSITNELKLTFLALQYNKLVEDKALKIRFNPNYSIEENIRTAFDNRLKSKKNDIAAVIRYFIDDPMVSINQSLNNKEDISTEEKEKIRAAIDAHIKASTVCPINTLEQFNKLSDEDFVNQFSNKTLRYICGFDPEYNQKPEPTKMSVGTLYVFTEEMKPEEYIELMQNILQAEWKTLEKIFEKRIKDNSEQNLLSTEHIQQVYSKIPQDDQENFGLAKDNRDSLIIRSQLPTGGKELFAQHLSVNLEEVRGEVKGEAKGEVGKNDYKKTFSLKRNQDNYVFGLSDMNRASTERDAIGNLVTREYNNEDSKYHRTTITSAQFAASNLKRATKETVKNKLGYMVEMIDTCNEKDGNLNPKKYYTFNFQSTVDIGETNQEGAFFDLKKAAVDAWNQEHTEQREIVPITISLNARHWLLDNALKEAVDEVGQIEQIISDLKAQDPNLSPKDEVLSTWKQKLGQSECSRLKYSIAGLEALKASIINRRHRDPILFVNKIGSNAKLGTITQILLISTVTWSTAAWYEKSTPMRLLFIIPALISIGTSPIRLFINLLRLMNDPSKVSLLPSFIDLNQVKLQNLLIFAHMQDGLSTFTVTHTHCKSGKDRTLIGEMFTEAKIRWEAAYREPLTEDALQNDDKKRNDFIKCFEAEFLNPGYWNGNCQDVGVMNIKNVGDMLPEFLMTNNVKEMLQFTKKFQKDQKHILKMEPTDSRVEEEQDNISPCGP